MSGVRLLNALVRRSLARAAAPMAAAAAVLGGFQVLLVLMAGSFEQARSFDLLSSMMPMVVQRSFGPEVLGLASFAGFVGFGYFHPVVVLTLIQAAIYVATEPAGEVEWGLFDLQLARPVARHWIVTRALTVSVVLVVGTLAAMLASTWAGMALFAPPDAAWPPAARVAALAAHLAALGILFAAAGLLAASIARRRSWAFGPVAFGAVVLYLLNFVADVWTPAARLHWITPFHYYPGFAVANGSAPVVRDLLVLALPALALTLAAYWQFNRRDL